MPFPQKISKDDFFLRFRSSPDIFFVFYICLVSNSFLHTFIFGVIYMENYVLIEGTLYFFCNNCFIKVTEYFSTGNKTLESVFVDYIKHISASA